MTDVPSRSNGTTVTRHATADLSSPELFLNRELTWLAFNRRVFAEALEEAQPLLERVKFLAITARTSTNFS